MIFYKLILLPLNLFIELLKFSDRLNDRNRGYLKYLYNEFKNRFKK